MSRQNISFYRIPSCHTVSWHVIIMSYHIIIMSCQAYHVTAYHHPLPYHGISSCHRNSPYPRVAEQELIEICVPPIVWWIVLVVLVPQSGRAGADWKLCVPYGVVDCALGLGAPEWPSTSWLKILSPHCVVVFARGLGALEWPSRSWLKKIPPPLTVW